jgi:hypothetical protein
MTMRGGVAAACVALVFRGVAAAVTCETILVPPGVAYLYPDDPTNATFNGNSFEIRGDDHTVSGAPASSPPVFGVATRTEANAEETRAACRPSSWTT